MGHDLCKGLSFASKLSDLVASARGETKEKKKSKKMKEAGLFSFFLWRREKKKKKRGSWAGPAGESIRWRPAASGGRKRAPHSPSSPISWLSAEANEEP